MGVVPIPSDLMTDQIVPLLHHHTSHFLIITSSCSKKFSNKKLPFLSSGFSLHFLYLHWSKFVFYYPQAPYLLFYTGCN